MPSPQNAAHGAGKSIVCMPNIELHSFGDQTRFVKEAVWTGFFHNETLITFADDVVLTTFPSESDNKHGRRSPFIRVFFETQKEMRICERILLNVPNLRKCFFDVEFVRVARFLSIPQK